MARLNVSGVAYLLILFGTVARSCTGARYVHYNEYALENEKICHHLHKKFTHDIRNATAALVKSYTMFDRWTVKADVHCKFVFRTAKGEGLFGVIQKMSFRRNGTQCLDYVRFKRTDGFQTHKFCGDIDLWKAPYSAVPESTDNSHNVDISSHNYNMYSEFDPGNRFSQAEFETEIFVSKEKLQYGQSLDISIVYTPYRNCNKMDPKQYWEVEQNICIRKQYICDRLYNCPLSVCSDEAECPYEAFRDLMPGNDTAAKVTVGAVTTMILCFIIFLMCLWMCKRTQKLCWSSDCAGPNVCSRPGSLPRESDGPVSPTVPTVPMLEVAVSSPVANKDLPPSYDSLFPERSDPARS